MIEIKQEMRWEDEEILDLSDGSENRYIQVEKITSI